MSSTDSERNPECKKEILEVIWTRVLQSWIAHCLPPRHTPNLITRANLIQILSNYKDDVEMDFKSRSLVAEYDLTGFLKLNYPMLRITDIDKTRKKKNYERILASVILFYCCTKSKGDEFDKAVAEMNRTGQEALLIYCERLLVREVTISNVKLSIKEACENFYQSLKKRDSVRQKPIVDTLYKNEGAVRNPSSSVAGATLGSKWLVAHFVSKCHIFPSETRRSRATDCDKTCGGVTKKTKWIISVTVLLWIAIMAGLGTLAITETSKKKSVKPAYSSAKFRDGGHEAAVPLRMFPANNQEWVCNNKICAKADQVTDLRPTYYSRSVCTLLCSGPQLWPYPININNLSKRLVSTSTKSVVSKLAKVPSKLVKDYLSEAFKLFINDLVKIENSEMQMQKETNLFEVIVEINVENDPDPKIRLDSVEGYTLAVTTEKDTLYASIQSHSFCGARHGLETLSQLFLVDQSTGFLITYSSIEIEDTPTFKYRGLMLDTARNFFPLTDVLRTVDAMAASKLNTLHWKITDAASFPLLLKSAPQLMENGAYDRSMIYTRDDVRKVVRRARVRGIRVLIEICSPGPVGRAWTWTPEVNCRIKNNDTCENSHCVRLNVVDSIFDTLQSIYSEILELTEVTDVYHLSAGLFSLSNCRNLLKDREGFLEKALERLALANGGLEPTLPLIWYNELLRSSNEAKVWYNRGVQVYDVLPELLDAHFGSFKAIHSSQWELSCSFNNARCHRYISWQAMYKWKSWMKMPSLTVEGGEALLWTDIVDSSALDSFIWPRAAAVAERLWSADLNSTVDPSVYLRLDSHNWRLDGRGVKGQPVWPLWCTQNPEPCLKKIIGPVQIRHP